MTDSEILKQMGLTASELTDLLQKTNDYYNSLNAAQKKVFLASQRTVKEAAATLHGDVTADELERFLRSHGKDADVLGFFCRINHYGGDDGDDGNDNGN